MEKNRAFGVSGSEKDGVAVKGECELSIYRVLDEEDPKLPGSGFPKKRTIAKITLEGDEITDLIKFLKKYESD